MKRPRVLIGSCGGLTGSYLTRQFCRRLGCYVVGADTTDLQVTRHFANDFVRLPAATDPRFYSQLVCCLREKEIDVYLPTHSKEIREVARLEHQLRTDWGGHFLVSPYQTYLELDQKQTANENLRKAGIPVPLQYLSPKDVPAYPVFMKPNSGSGSQRAQSVPTAGLHREFAAADPDASFYECIEGTEYTVDCLFDIDGHLVGYNPRIRQKSMGGAVIVSKNDHSFDIAPYLQALSSHFLFRGCVNFQYIVRDDIPYFIDINLRYASGGLPLTVASGLDIPRLLLELLDGKVISPLGCCGNDGLTMYRYFDEYFEIT